MKFEDVLDKYRVNYQTEGRYCREGWIQFQCPYCNTSGTDPDKPYMGYSKAGGYINCWRCGRHGLAQTLALLTNTSIATAKNELKGLEYDYIERERRTGKLVIPKGVTKMKMAHRDYLRSRNFVPANMERLWDVQGIGIASRLPWRLFIPIYHCGEMVSWTTRAVGKDVTPRYISAAEEEEALPHKELLYGADYCRHAAIICEGPTSVWRIGPGAVATLGVGYTRAQLLAMSRFLVRIICFDSEPEAQERAKRLCNDLSPFEGETYRIELDSPDPAEAGTKEIKALRKLLTEG